VQKIARSVKFHYSSYGSLPRNFASLLKLLWTEKRVKQVNEQTESRNAGDDIVHGFFLLELVTGFGEGPADNQKQATDCNVEQIEHRTLSFL
jgi:hypothetical protein